MKPRNKEEKRVRKLEKEERKEAKRRKIWFKALECIDENVQLKLQIDRLKRQVKIQYKRAAALSIEVADGQREREKIKNEQSWQLHDARSMLTFLEKMLEEKGAIMEMEGSIPASSFWPEVPKPSRPRNEST